MYIYVDVFILNSVNQMCMRTAIIVEENLCS